MERLLDVKGHVCPTAKHGGVVAADRAVGFVGLVVDENGILAEQLVLRLLVHDIVVFQTLSLKGIAKAQSHKQDHRQ